MYGKGGCLWPSYGRPIEVNDTLKPSRHCSPLAAKVDPLLKKIANIAVSKRNISPKIFENELAIVYGKKWFPWRGSLSKNFGRYISLWHLIFLLTDRTWSHSPDIGQPKHGQETFLPPFHIDILNPECVRIPWALAPKNFRLKIFGDRAIYKKVPFFTLGRIC